MGFPCSAIAMNAVCDKKFQLQPEELSHKINFCASSLRKNNLKTTTTQQTDQKWQERKKKKKKLHQKSLLCCQRRNSPSFKQLKLISKSGPLCSLYVLTYLFSFPSPIAPASTQSETWHCIFLLFSAKSLSCAAIWSGNSCWGLSQHPERPLTYVVGSNIPARSPVQYHMLPV